MASTSSFTTKPLTWTDGSGHVYQYYANPLTKACLFILIQEMCERLAFYGLMPNLKNFLNEFLHYDDNMAFSYISMFQAIMYVTPILAAVIADTFLGLYATILLFSVIYIGGLALLAVAAIPAVSQPWMVHVGLLVLLALGAGGIKSCVNVMGAQQFHPEHHKARITGFYTYFYASIQLGGILGGVATPIVVQDVSFFAGMLIPLCAFGLATVVFVVGDVMGRYVKPTPQGSAVLQVMRVLVSSVKKCSTEKCKKSQGGEFEDDFIEDAKMIFRLIPLFSLTIPFQIAYQQMMTAWVTQGEKMDRNTFGWNMPAPIMQNVDPIAVVVTSVVVDALLFPALRNVGLMPSVLVRFFIGSLLAAAALLCATLVEYVIMANPIFTVSIWWQVPQFWLIAAGEIFLITTSYEVAFTQSPSSLKAVASAVNLLFFAVGGALAGLLCKLCASWMPNFDPKKPTAAAHTGARYDYYFLVLAGICVLGAIGALFATPYFNKVAAKNQARLADAKTDEEV